MKRLTLIVVILFFFLPNVVSAGQPSPSVGIPIPDASLTTQSDSASLEVNPAGLGHLQGVEGSYGFFLPSSDYQLVIPSGHAVSAGIGGQFGGVGVGMQWLDNPQLENWTEDFEAGPDRRSFRKTTVGGALSLSRLFSVGGNVNFFSSRTDQRLNALRTVDLGVQWRPSRVLGFGLLGRDVTPAFLDEQEALPLRLGVGVAMRALEGRIVLDHELHFVQDADSLEYQPRLAIEPLSGLRIFGHTNIGIPLPDRDEDGGFQGFSAGLELSTGSFGAQGAAHLGEFGTSDASAVTGMSYRFYGGSIEKRSLFEPRNRWVEFELDGSIAEQAASPFLGTPVRSFMNLINDIHSIADDPSVQGIVLTVGNVGLGHAQIWELDQALQQLHDAGKQSIAVIQTESPTTSVVYAASSAQQVWMRPTTPYGPTGLQTTFTSYAGLFDRLGLEAEFMRIGDYKSAPESFVLTEPSEPALEQTGAYLDALYGELTEKIATRREVDVEQVRTIIDNTPLYPADALDQGLIDALLYDEEVEQMLTQYVGNPANLESGYEPIVIADERWGGNPEIAVIYIDGLITSGESGSSPFGGEVITGAKTVQRTLRQLRADNNVKAVVVRIDSPGGSAVGSDVIFREMRHLATTKPVIASMGNVAASGGYYIAAGADEIFATPVTLTGSIGIYSGKFNIETLASSFGINSQSEQRGERAGVFSPWQPWTESEREGVASTLEYLYELFLQQVASTRPLSEEEVDAVARGRVWTGEAALEEELVDTSGGIFDALRQAESLAGLEPGEANYIDRSGAGGQAMSPGMVSRLSKILDRFGLSSDTNIATPTGQVTSALKDMESSLLWPLYFDSGEAVFLLPYKMSVD